MNISREQQIKEIICSLGADVCGIGSIDRFGDAPEGFSPADLYPRCKSVIAFGITLPKGLMDVSPKYLYEYFNGQVVLTKVDEVTLSGARALEKVFDCAAVPIPCDSPCEYWDPENITAKGLMSMKHAAVACGIGEIGKNSLLLNPDYGNQLTVGAILTDMELKSDELCDNICIPECTICIDGCPVSAINDKQVSQKLCRPNTYRKDSRGQEIVECNECRKNCPMRFGK